MLIMQWEAQKREFYLRKKYFINETANNQELSLEQQTVLCAIFRLPPGIMSRNPAWQAASQKTTRD